MKYSFVIFIFLTIPMIIYTSPLQVTSGGTGVTSLTAYAILCGGTTSTGSIQQVASVGTAGQFLTSNGASALPTFQSGGLVLIATRTASDSASLVFDNTEITTIYKKYLIVIDSLVPSASQSLQMDWSTDNGGSYVASGYTAGVNSNPYNSITVTNSNSTTFCPLTGAALVVHSGYLIMYGLNGSTANGPFYVGNTIFGTTISYGMCSGYNSGALNVNNIRFAMSSGEIVSGKISLYGFAQ